MQALQATRIHDEIILFFLKTFNLKRLKYETILIIKMKRTAANGLLLKDNKLLLLKRSSKKELFANHWGCPGGGTENNETAEECATREVKEECNLDFIPNKLFFLKKDPSSTATTSSFLGDWSGEIKLNEESSDYGWFTYEDIENLNLAFTFRVIIDKLHKEGYI